jgi:N-methylhydantoinase A
MVDASLFERAKLATGVYFRGPAVIVEDGTSTIVPNGFTGRIGADEEIVIEEDQT